jgi:hypothetical protein
MASNVDNGTRNRGCRSRHTSWWARENKEGPEHGNQWAMIGFLQSCCKKCPNDKNIEHISKFDISGWNWMRPEREDDARRHRNGLGPRNSQRNVENPCSE